MRRKTLSPGVRDPGCRIRGAEVSHDTQKKARAVWRLSPGGAGREVRKTARPMLYKAKR